MRTVKSNIAWLGALAALAMLVAPTQAQTTYTWMPGGNVDAGGNWNLTNTNWNSGSGQTQWVNNNIAAFGLVTGQRTVTLTADVLVDTLTFQNLRTTSSLDWVINADTTRTMTLIGNARIDPANNNAHVRIDAPILGSAGLLMQSSGARGTSAEVRLAGNNTYTGVTTVRNSTLCAYHNNAFGSSAANDYTLVEYNGRVQIGGSGISALTVNETFVIRMSDAAAAQGSAIRLADAAHVLNGPIIFWVGSSTSTRDRGPDAATNHTFTLNGNITTVAAVSGSDARPRIMFRASGGTSSKLVVNGAITENASHTVRLLIDGPYNLNTGIVELAGNNTFTDEITLRRGTLLVSNNNALGVVGSDPSRYSILISDGGTGENGHTLRVLTTGNYTVSRWIRFENPSSSYTYTAVVGGDSAGTSTFTGNLTVNSARANTYNLTAATGGTVYFSGLIDDGANTAAFNKTGAGTVVLSRAGGNTFDGGMNVLAGTLLVTNTSGSATGTGAVTVAAGATLGGTGIITGATTINGTLAPGASPGTLTISNSLTLDSGATLAFELNGTDTTVGGGINDLVTGVTNLTLNGTLNVTETVAGSFLSATAGSKWRLFNYSGTLTDNGLTLGTMPTIQSGWSFSLDTSTANQVNLVLIPEPGTVGLAAIGVLLARFMRRQRI